MPLPALRIVITPGTYGILHHYVSGILLRTLQLLTHLISIRGLRGGYFHFHLKKEETELFTKMEAPAAPKAKAEAEAEGSFEDKEGSAKRRPQP